MGLSKMNTFFEKSKSRAYLGALIFSLVAPNAALGAGDVPDFSGLWATNGDARAATRVVDGRLANGTPAEPGPGAPPPLTDEGRRLYEINKAGIEASDSSIDQGLRCVPSGFPRTAFNVSPVLIMQNEDVVAWLGESSHGIPRKIWMTDEHQNMWPFRMGDTIGHWEGQTLVVDTKNIHHTTFFNTSGLPHSGELHVVERWDLIEGGTKLENKVTFNDPIVFTEPWEITIVYERTTNRPIENICTDPLPLYQ